MFRSKYREPDFSNLELILQKKAAPRPVLFDFILGKEKEKFLAAEYYRVDSEFNRVLTTIKAFDSAGYDFAPIIVRGLIFERKNTFNERALTKSLNDCGVITERSSFEKYSWPEIHDCDFSIIKRAGDYLSSKSRFIPFSHDGILENTIGIVGYENLCLMLYENEGLLSDIFFEVGKRIKEYYSHCLEYETVGALILNDDWGFNTHTMLSPISLRKYVFPWYKEIVSMAHSRGKYAILHSCGKYDGIIEDIITDMKFDARHSYEDNITPVEKAYEDLHNQLAVLGGIDVDFLARSTGKAVHDRCVKILEQTKERGGYALGSGNSVPDFIPNENYIELLKTALNKVC